MWGPVEPQGRKKERGKRDGGQEREEALRFAEEILRSDQKDLRSVLYRDILLNALKAKRDELDILDLKVINRAMAEFRYAARVFKPYRGVRKVSIFGSGVSSSGRDSWSSPAPRRASCAPGSKARVRRTPSASTSCCPSRRARPR